MDEITPQRIGEFLRIVILLLWPEKAGLPVGEIMAFIPQATPLTEFEREVLPSTRMPRYARTIRLATTPYVKAGWLMKSKGRWFLTGEGKRACKRYPSAQAFDQEAGRIFDEWRQNCSLQALVTEEAGEMAWEQIQSYLQEMQPFEFQRLAEDLLRAMGYHVAWVAPAEKERGFVNFVIHADPLGLSTPRIKVHVMHGGQPVMVEGLKAFMSFLGPEEAGIFISSGGFTRNVKEESQAQTPDRVALIDLEVFFDLWVEYYDRLTHAARQRFPLQSILFLSLVE